MTSQSGSEPSAKVRGDSYFEIAEQKLQEDELLSARDAASQAVVFRRMFYGKNSPEVNEALELARQIQARLVQKDPSLAPRRRGSKKK